MCPRSIAGVPSSQALPGYLITAPPSMCVSDVIVAGVTVWIQNQKKKSLTGKGFLATILFMKYSSDGQILGTLQF